MGTYKYVRELWKQPKKNLGEIWQSRLIKWRKSPVTVRVDRPTRIDRARSLGYKAKQGFIIVRQRVNRGGHTRPTIRSGRKPKKFGQRKNLDMNYQRICEVRAQKKFPNCTVLNSYYVGEDGKHYWYEVILVDRSHPNIIADKNINWICFKKGRANRGLTSAGKRSIGIRRK